MPAKPNPSIPLSGRISSAFALNLSPTRSSGSTISPGAYIRVGEPAEAVKLLEPARDRFPNDYGVRANLGTAYHLLGRYAEAEKEIAKDLEINPNAHFGLEKYHLALLQYLSRDRDYQSRHLYIDEWTGEFFKRRGTSLRFVRRYETRSCRKITNLRPRNKSSH
jgi:tetratricopeptide (TPR) repeat protein